MKIVETNGNQVFNVPNSAQGREFVNSLKIYLNSSKYQVKARGRGKNRVAKGGNGQDISPDKSDWLAVYVTKKESYYWDAYNRGRESERDSILRLIENRG